MKSDGDYLARVQECFLLFLTNAAFLIQLSLKSEDQRLQSAFHSLSASYQESAETLFDLFSGKSETHLNPALYRKSSGNTAKDFSCVKMDALHLEKMLLLLSAYAPDASVRKTIMDLISKTRKNEALLRIIA